MSSPRRDRDYLVDIYEAMHRIIEYTGGFSYEEFLDDTKTQDAVIRNIQVMGEATKKLSEETRRAHPEIPWRQMAGIRDRVVHDYFGLNLEIIWTIAQSELPPLLSQLDAMLVGPGL